VHFGANIDIHSWEPQMNELKKCIPEWLMCQSRYDVLRLCRQQVQGMSTPQLYMKVAGVWTGTHEENDRFHSVNCCHGPEAASDDGLPCSEWFCVAPQSVPRARDVVKQHFGIDLYSSRGEGRFFLDPDFLLAHDIPGEK
jgi:hypothetical protein